MLDVSQALQRMLSSAAALPSQSLSLSNSLHCVLSSDLSTPHDSPPFDKSMMDGFAVNSAEAANSPAGPFRVLETITAGTLPQHSPGIGTASRIMTGAPLPAGADCVIPIERTQFDEQQPDSVTIDPADVAPEKHVLRQGQSVRSGSPLLSQGTLLAPRHIAVLAEFGFAEVPVIPQPRVAVLATGDELIPAGEPLGPGRIRNSNEPMLAAQIQRAAGVPVPLGIAQDNIQDLDQHIQQGLQQDVLLLSGGVSAGTLDLVPARLQAAGVSEIFHKVNMKPGKPLWFGRCTRDDSSCLVVGLPGNPVSSMVCFEVFVRPLLEVLAGRTPHGTRNQQARLAQEITIRGDRPTFFPSRLTLTPQGLSATPVAWGGSADLRSVADANGVCCLSPGTHSQDASVPVISWDQPSAPVSETSSQP